MMRGHKKQSGSTLVELVIGLFILGMISLAFFGFYNALITGSVAAKQKAVASTLVTNQMEYIKSLPYNSLAVAGGSIYTTTPLPASSTQKVNNYTYTVKTSINYVDDAFDGCTNYPTNALKQKYCRNFPSPAGAPATDLNPEDYKIVHISAYNRSNVLLAEVDTQISARVAETASNTGSLFTNVIDAAGAPVQGATVTVTNTALNPNVIVSDTTDSGGIAIFYGLPPDTTGFHYGINATKDNYSSLSTILPSGSLQPNYPSQNIFAQQPSYATLAINPQASDSIAIETVGTNGAPLNNVKIYAKGGYKKYNLASNTSYYFDNFTPDTRVTTNGSGQAAFQDLAPGNYYFCGDDGSSNCSRSGTTYYLAAAVPYAGSSILSPISVPTDSATAPTWAYGSGNYIQKVRLIMTSNTNFPRVTTMTPSEASLSGGTISSFAFQISGANLPCSSTAASCNTTVTLSQGATSYVASCIGASAGIQLNCTVDLSGATAERTSIDITANGSTLSLPGSPLLGGINVAP